MKIFINGEYITICQLLKKLGIIFSGGEAKSYIKNNNVKINKINPKGKNSKIYVGSKVMINDKLYYIIPKI